MPPILVPLAFLVAGILGAVMNAKAGFICIIVAAVLMLVGAF